jgi:hypothetical protein
MNRPGEPLTQRRNIARIHSLFKAYKVERTWEAMQDRQQRPFYLIMSIMIKKIRLLSIECKYSQRRVIGLLRNLGQLTELKLANETGYPT